MSTAVPSRGGEGGLQHQRLVHVSAADLELACGPDREMPAGRVKEAAEHRRPVEAGEAEPVHRAVPADQRRGAAVREQRILADRQAVHHGFLS